MEETQNTEAAETNLIPELTINVKGLALVYKKTGEAMVKMRIPEVDDHDPIIRITTDTQIGTKITSKTRVFSIPIGGSIEITHTGALEAADPLLDGVIKMNELHPAVKFKPLADLKDISALITITHAKFTADQDNEEDFERWQVNDLLPSATLPQGKPRGKREFIKDDLKIFPTIIGEVSFDQSSQKGTQIRIMGIGKNTFDIVLEYSNDSSIKITHIIDIINLCESGNDSCETKSDFLEYYEILDRTTTGNKEFDFVVPDLKGARAPCNVSYFENGYNPEQ